MSLWWIAGIAVIYVVFILALGEFIRVGSEDIDRG